MQKRHLFVLILSVVVFYLVPATAGSATPQDDALVREGIEHLSAYLAIDTTNPPGHEMATARFLKGILDHEGIENRIFDLGKGRANLLAILRGSGKKKGVILLHHMDVVPADPKFWTVPPFSGKVVGGEIYGRGAVDIKGKGIIDLMALIDLHRRRVPLDRDLLFLAVADEECDSLGSRWMTEHQAGLLKGAEFLIDEGQTILKGEDGKIKGLFVAIAEKLPLWVRVTCRGTPGHGSVPLSDSAPNRLLRAGNRLLAWRPELRCHPALVESIRFLLENRDPRWIPGFRTDLLTSLRQTVFLRDIATNPRIKACLTDTVAITRLQGSDKTNTIPNEAWMTLDCRLLPGTDPQAFLAQLRAIIHDPAAELTVETPPSPGPTRFSPADSEFLRVLRECASRQFPRVPVAPVILTSSTDSLYYRALGIDAYGFEPYCLTADEYDLSHGNNERISTANVAFGIRWQSDFLERLAGRH